MTRTGCFLDFYGKTARTVEVHLVMAPLRIPSFRFASPCIPQHTRHSLVLTWSPHLGQSTLPYLTTILVYPKPKKRRPPPPLSWPRLAKDDIQPWRATEESNSIVQVLCNFGIAPYSNTFVCVSLQSFDSPTFSPNKA